MARSWATGKRALLQWPTLLRSQIAQLSPVGRIGRYEILGRLATGGMAEIFLARESGPAGASREVVVKRMLPQTIGKEERMREMFAQEARLLLRLRHPNICAVHEFNEEHGGFFLAMEWVDGVSLRQLVERAREHGGIPVPIVARVGADVAAALHHAHTRTGDDGRALGIVHRDVSPENVMIGFDGVVKLLDFGVARVQTEGTPQLTKAGELKGKLAYISPEQYRGRQLDGRSDVFSLGVTLYEALTGESLYARANEYETVAAIVLGANPTTVRGKRADVPEPLDRTIIAAIAKDKEDRFATAEELETSLLHVLESSQAVRPADLARYVGELFATEREQGPALDRTPLPERSMRETDPAPSVGARAAEPKPAAVAGPPPRVRLDTGERLVFEADIEEEAGGWERRARRKRMLVTLAAAAVVIGMLVASAIALGR